MAVGGNGEGTATVIAKKVAWTAMVSRGPGRKRSHNGPYPTSAELQPAGEHFAKAWIDAAHGFLSCFFHALTDDIGERVAAMLQAARDADLWLSPAHLPTAETWNLTRVLCGLAEAGLRPAVDDVLMAARLARLDITDGAGDERAELEAVLWRDSSAALLVHHAEHVRTFGELARRLKTTWRDALTAVNAYPRIFHEADREATQILVHLDGRRISA